MKPVPVIQSPSRPVKVNNIQDWKILPSISKWKNSRGYAKRLTAYGNGLQELVLISIT